MKMHLSSDKSKCLMAAIGLYRILAMRVIWEKIKKKSNSPLVFLLLKNSRRFRLFIVFDQIRIVFANQDDI